WRTSGNDRDHHVLNQGRCVGLLSRSLPRILCLLTPRRRGLLRIFWSVSREVDVRKTTRQAAAGDAIRKVALKGFPRQPFLHITQSGWLYFHYAQPVTLRGREL
ncbi:MAG: hypothetical protein ACPIOQ_68940, partial [Promethearchaeia archaeon]